MWALMASVVAVVGTALQVVTALKDLKRNHEAEIETWDTETRLMDELRWWRLIERRRRYRELVEMRSSDEHEAIVRIRMVLIGWVALMSAAIFYMIDQIGAQIF